MSWELKEVKDIEATLDDSGVYVVINRVVAAPAGVRIRADLMQKQNFTEGDHIIHRFGQCSQETFGSVY